jgi:phage terminase small subunit
MKRGPKPQPKREIKRFQPEVQRANHMEQIFVREYLTNGCNVTRAAMRAGYEAEPSMAAARGMALLRKQSVKYEIALAMSEHMYQYNVTQDGIIQELAAIAFFDPKDLFDNDGKMRDVHDMPQQARKALLSFDQEMLFEKGEGGEKMIVGQTRKLRFHSKEKALELLTKLMGLYTDKLKIEAKSESIQRIEMETTVRVDLDERIKMLQSDAQAKVNDAIEKELGDALQ